MTRKEYLKPTIKVVEVNYKSHILAGSLQGAESKGLGSNGLQYSGDGGSPSSSWSRSSDDDFWDE
jgi:hypothetical protein